MLRRESKTYPGTHAEYFRTTIVTIDPREKFWFQGPRAPLASGSASHRVPPMSATDLHKSGISRTSAVAGLLLLFATSSALAAPPDKAKVLIIGIDGVSLNLLEPFIDQGVTPHLGQLAKQGARGDLSSIWPLRTPQVWTSVVTGKLPGQHGIWDHLSNTYFNPPEVRTQKKMRVTSAQRRSKALWTLLGEHNVRTLTVGWMASWPAESVPKGVMVAPTELMGDKRQTTIKGSFYRGASRMVSPARWEKEVERWIVDPGDVRDEELQTFADIPPDDSALYALPYLKRYVYGLKWSLARARSVERITTELFQKTQPEVVLSYFQCPDSLLHRFWIFHRSPEDIRIRLRTHGLPTEGAGELHRRFGRVVEACYRDVDQRVGKLLKTMSGPETLVLVVSDHGFGPAPVPHKMKGEPYSGDHLEEGVILARGPGIMSNSRIEGASVLDITPTVLHQMGFEVGDDMRGKVLQQWFDRTKRPIQRRATYEKSPQLEAPYAEGWPPRRGPPRRAKAP